MILNSSMKFLFVLRRCLAFSLLLFSVQTIAQEVIPDFYREPGLNPNRSYVNQNFNEQNSANFECWKKCISRATNVFGHGHQRKIVNVDIKF